MFKITRNITLYIGMILSVYKLFYNYKILYKKSIDHS